MNERLAAANAAAGWGPFTPDEQRQIDRDATTSADVLFYDLARPPQLNAKIHRALALELIEHHIDKGQYRKVIQPLSGMLAFQRAYRKQQTTDKQYVIDYPWEAGTKFRGCPGSRRT